ncbi:MAG: ParB N-terminal domain-containing protein [Treponema sp.]|jgi:hypothetical protein|nr:ParB N-terminal domain-containing protein [Treponema sp.]
MGKQKTEKAIERPAGKKGEQKTLRITCRGADSLPLDAIEEFQGNLKKRTKKDTERLIKSILKYGFSAPFFVWQGDGHNYCMDGHGRIKALSELRKQGYDLPLFPAVYIEAVSADEAKQKLLRIDSRYGAITQEGFAEFTASMEIEMAELSLPDLVISVDSEASPVKYSEKIELIIECNNEGHSSELYSEFKERGLKCRISTL